MCSVTFTENDSFDLDTCDFVFDKDDKKFYVRENGTRETVDDLTDPIAIKVESGSLKVGTVSISNCTPQTIVLDFDADETAMGISGGGLVVAISDEGNFRNKVHMIDISVHPIEIELNDLTGDWTITVPCESCINDDDFHKTAMVYDEYGGLP